MKKYFNFFPKGGTNYDTDYGAIYVTPPLGKKLKYFFIELSNLI